MLRDILIFDSKAKKTNFQGLKSRFYSGRSYHVLCSSTIVKTDLKKPFCFQCIVLLRYSSKKAEI